MRWNLVDRADRTVLVVVEDTTAVKGYQVSWSISPDQDRAARHVLDRAMPYAKNLVEAMNMANSHVTGAQFEEAM